ncbi:MAG: folate-binding protein, partial [Rhodoblastus sp.]|nr:folate-binding protein [Rhodoblastus sp.]
MPAVLLTDRAVLSVSGADARHFLQGLVTCDMTKISAEAPGFGALLTPQGKILFDFLIAQDGERFLLDTSREKAADLLKRLTFYRLR